MVCDSATQYQAFLCFQLIYEAEVKGHLGLWRSPGSVLMEFTNLLALPCEGQISGAQCSKTNSTNVCFRHRSIHPPLLSFGAVLSGFAAGLESLLQTRGSLVSGLGRPVGVPAAIWKLYALNEPTSPSCFSSFSMFIGGTVWLLVTVS